MPRNLGRGRQAWFCSPDHRRTFRLRGEALERALLDLAIEEDKAEAADHRRAIVVYGNWLTVVRRQYEPLTADTARSDDVNTNATATLVWSVIRDIVGEPIDAEKCPLCAGTGQKWKRFSYWRHRSHPRLTPNELLVAASRMLEDWALATSNPGAILRLQAELDRLQSR